MFLNKKKSFSLTDVKIPIIDSSKFFLKNSTANLITQMSKDFKHLAREIFELLNSYRSNPATFITYLEQRISDGKINSE